jgi:POT family proton-dependent oligopeptide transporter
MVYIGAAFVAPLFAVLVFSARSFKVIPDFVFGALTQSENVVLKVVGTVLAEMSTLPGLLLFVTGAIATIYLLWESIRSPKIERQRLWVIVVLMFFSMLFWAFFEQGGSSMNNFTDRNVDRVQEDRNVDVSEIGTTVAIDLNQEQLGMVNDDPSMKLAIVAALRHAEKERPAETNVDERAKRQQRLDAKIAFVQGEAALTMTGLDALKEVKGHKDVSWKVNKGNVGMGIGGSEIPASTYQSANAIFIVLFGLVFTGMWTLLGKMGREPSTPVKFGLGLLQLGLGFVALWYGAQIGDERGMSNMFWLLLGYLLFTTGELCLSPVGLSMITKLSPKRLVSTVMGAWFLATAFSSLLASVIATFTGVGQGDGPSVGVPVPAETLSLYGDVFGVIAILIGVATLVMFALSVPLTWWMHQDAEASEAVDAA